MSLKIATCQYETELGNKEENLSRSLKWIEKAGEHNPDLIVLPELITTGYKAGEKFLEMAEPVPGETTEKWGEKAEKFGTYLIGGMCRRDESVRGKIYNSAVLINSEGSVAGVYDKVILPLYVHTLRDESGNPVLIDEADLFCAGNSLPVFETEIGTIGVQICQDAVYPEMTRVQVLKGADIIVQILNGPAVETEHEKDITPLTTRVHAFDNSTYIVLANKCGSEEFEYSGSPMSVTFHGESHIVDPEGNFVSRAKVEEEDLLLGEIELEKVEKARWGMKLLRDWRPELFQELGRR